MTTFKPMITAKEWIEKNIDVKDLQENVSKWYQEGLKKNSIDIDGHPAHFIKMIADGYYGQTIPENICVSYEIKENLSKRDKEILEKYTHEKYEDVEKRVAELRNNAVQEFEEELTRELDQISENLPGCFYLNYKQPEGVYLLGDYGVFYTEEAR